MIDRRTAIDRFYEILQRNIAKQGCHQFRDLPSLRSNPKLDRPGIYFLFEPTEFRENGAARRVVYIGISRILRDRLEKHSKHSDASTLAEPFFEAVARSAGRAEFDEFFSQSWAKIPEPTLTEMRQFQIESVLPWIRELSFTWLPVLSADQKQQIEEGAIALLSNFPRPDVESPIDPSSPTWLGRKVRRSAISQSGLWNREGVKRDIGGCAWLGEFESLVAEPL